MGESLDISATIHSTADTHQHMVIDYAIHFVKANGQTKPKVFKWKNLKLKPHEKVLLNKTHVIKEITTRHYFPGIHKIELLVNGKTKAVTEFMLQITSL